jgi:hypothetical protein
MPGQKGNSTLSTSETARRDARSETNDSPRARGGVSVGGILTGVVVAFGATFLLSAIIGGILAALGVTDPNVTRNATVDAGIAGGVAFAIAMLLAYLWGGYTAGRMARGAGVLNGVLVPVVAILVAVIVGAIGAALGATVNLNLPLTTARLPVQGANIVSWGVGLGVAALVAMFVGGIVGGMLGARWHTKLEHRAANRGPVDESETEILQALHGAIPERAGSQD